MSQVIFPSSDIKNMTNHTAAYSLISDNFPGGNLRGESRIEWEYEECTERNSKAFLRLDRIAEVSGAKIVVLDMSRCRYLSVTGLRNIMEWRNRMSGLGISVRIGGLIPLLRNVFTLARLDWILEK